MKGYGIPTYGYWNWGIGTKECGSDDWGYKGIDGIACVDTDGEDCEPPLLESKEGVSL